MESARKLLLVGAIAIVVGSIMPWGKVSTVFGTMTINGTEGDGIITIILGAIMLLVAFARKGTPGRIYSSGSLILALITLFVSVVTMFRMSGAAAEANSDYASASIGSGVFITIIGSIVAATGSSRKLASVQQSEFLTSIPSSVTDDEIIS